jgi:hypothetical protein
MKIGGSMKKARSRPTITAADIAWDMTDTELVRYGFLLIREKFKKSPLAEVVMNQTLDAEERILSKL